MEDKEKYIKLTKSLDSLRDVALAEIRLIEDEGKKDAFSDFIVEKIKTLLFEIAKSQFEMWGTTDNVKGQKFIDHGEKLKNQPPTLIEPTETNWDCPPGFIEVDGVCVPI